MVIRQELIVNNRPGGKINPTTVTVHNTANPNTTAQNNRDYFSNHPNAKVSTHWVVDDKEAIKCVPEYEPTWHAGPAANYSSISIEVCEFTDSKRQEKCNDNAAQLVADILTRYKWNIDKVTTHQNWTGKYCPRKLLPMWDQFVNMVKQYLPKDVLMQSLEVLRDNKIISSFDYWLANARPDQLCKGDFVASLIIKMAAKLKGGI